MPHKKHVALPCPLLDSIKECLQKTIRAGNTNIHDAEEALWNQFPEFRLYHNQVHRPDTPLITESKDKFRVHLEQSHPNLVRPLMSLWNSEKTLPSDAITETITVKIRGAGPCGLATALALANAGIKVSLYEKRPQTGEKRFDARTGSLSFKSHEWLDEQLGEHVDFLSETETVRFPEEDVYSPNAYRATTGTYQRALYTALSKHPNCQLIRFARSPLLDELTEHTDLVISATGASYQPELSAQTFVENLELRTHAETGIEFFEETQRVPGFYRENNYMPPYFHHTRDHVGTGMQLTALIDAVLAANPKLPSGERTKLINLKTKPLVVFRYHMRNKEHEEDMKFSYLLNAKQFDIVPSKITPSFAAIPDRTTAHAVIGDASGQVHFIGGYGQSKGACEAHILVKYCQSLALLREAGADTIETRQLLQALTGIHLAEVVEAYYATSLLDAIWCQV